MHFFIAVLILVGLCIAGLCFNIIFRKNGSFPQTEIESNDEMKKLGIKCAKQEEIELWKKHGKTEKPVCNSQQGCASCEGCMFGKREG